MDTLTEDGDYEVDISIGAELADRAIDDLRTTDNVPQFRRTMIDTLKGGGAILTGFIHRIAEEIRR